MLNPRRHLEPTFHVEKKKKKKKKRERDRERKS
jgi:hypothetical protein